MGNLEKAPSRLQLVSLSLTLAESSFVPGRAIRCLFQKLESSVECARERSDKDVR